MINFNKALKKILKHEGGYVNDPDDSGGETIFGVSRKNNPKWEGWVIVDNIKKNPVGYWGWHFRNSKELATAVEKLYSKKYWRNRMNNINSQGLGEAVLDVSINMGFKTSCKMLQTACNEYFTSSYIAVDGIVGPITLKAVNTIISYGSATELTNIFNKLRIDRYFVICKRRPSQYKFLKGWLRRTSTFIARG